MTVLCAFECLRPVLTSPACMGDAQLKPQSHSCCAATDCRCSADRYVGMQAWLVPHEASDTGSIGCGTGAVPAVHSGFSASWQSGLKQAVCTALQKAVKHSSRPASQMRMLVTGQLLCWATLGVWHDPDKPAPVWRMGILLWQGIQPISTSLHWESCPAGACVCPCKAGMYQVNRLHQCPVAVQQANYVVQCGCDFVW